MSKPRLLDLFCGAGGAAVGYYRAGFEVVGFDHVRQPHYPFQMFVLDALVLPIEYYRRFDAIHASPPCQGYVERNKNLETKHPKLIAATRDLLTEVGLPYVIENVEGAREHLYSPVMLCGTMFDLPIRRHRLFEADCLLDADLPKCHHWGSVAHGDFAAVYGMGGKGPRLGAGVREPSPRPGAPPWEIAMGIDWMTRNEMIEAIPPAYTEYIGKQLMAVLS